MQKKPGLKTVGRNLTILLERVQTLLHSSTGPNPIVDATHTLASTSLPQVERREKGSTVGSVSRTKSNLGHTQPSSLVPNFPAITSLITPASLQDDSSATRDGEGAEHLEGRERVGKTKLEYSTMTMKLSLQMEKGGNTDLLARALTEVTG